MRYLASLLPLIVLVVGIFVVPGTAEAQLTVGAGTQTGFTGQLVPVQCDNPQACGTCEFVQLINNIIRFLITFSIIAATLVIIYSGFRLVTSGGDVSAKQNAKSMITNVLIGVVLVLTGFLIINTILGVLLPGDSRVLGWQQVECLYPTAPVERRYNEFEAAEQFGQDGFIGFTNQRGSGSCTPAASGPCSAAALRSTFGNLAEQAAQIVGMESGCSATALSRTDQTSDSLRNTTSVGVWQIHMPAHQVNCNGQSLNCPSAFRDTGRRNEFNVKIFEVTNTSLYDQCVEALQDPVCNSQIAGRLARNAGDMGDWACSARRCGIATSRNDQCPLP